MSAGLGRTQAAVLAAFAGAAGSRSTREVLATVFGAEATPAQDRALRRALARLAALGHLVDLGRGRHGRKRYATAGAAREILRALQRSAAAVEREGTSHPPRPIMDDDLPRSLLPPGAALREAMAAAAEREARRLASPAARRALEALRADLAAPPCAQEALRLAAADLLHERGPEACILRAAADAARRAVGPSPTPADVAAILRIGRLAFAVSRGRPEPDLALAMLAAGIRPRGSDSDDDEGES